MSSTIEVRVPDIGDFKNIPVIDVLVEPGMHVEPEAPLITLESDKATIDVPAPAGGLITEIIVQKGQRVSQGTLILKLESANTKPSQLGQDTTPERPADPARSSASPAASVAATIGAPAVVSSTAPSPPPEATDSVNEFTVGPDKRRLYAGPAVRALSRALDVDLGLINGTGPRGRITKEDVETYAKAVRPKKTPVSPEFERFGSIERQSLTRIGRLTAQTMARNWSAIPHVTNFAEADVTELERFREGVNRGRTDARLTILAFLIKAAAGALREHPHVNASLEGDALLLKRYHNVGFAVDTQAGLVVPVIRDVDRKGLIQIAAEIRDLSARAREGKLRISDLEGGCFTISSLGAIDGTGFTPIINAPEIAILGVARAGMHPVWDGTQFVPRLMLPLALSWDHRALSGAPAARFLASIASYLTDLKRLML